MNACESNSSPACCGAQLSSVTRHCDAPKPFLPFEHRPVLSLVRAGPDEVGLVRSDLVRHLVTFRAPLTEYWHVHRRVRRISENNGRSQENKFKEGDVGKQPDRVTQPESENSTDEIRKQSRIGKQESENNTNKIKKQKRKSEKGRNHLSVLPTSREVKEGRTPLTLLSPLGLGHKPKCEGRPRSFHPSVLATPGGEGRPRSFHPFVLPTNRVVKEGRAPFTIFHPSAWPHTEM